MNDVTKKTQVTRKENVITKPNAQTAKRIVLPFQEGAICPKEENHRGEVKKKYNILRSKKNSGILNES